MTDTLILHPNIESLTTTFLRAQPEIAAIFGGTDVASRVVTALGTSQAFPAARVILFDSVHVTQRPQHLTKWSLQIDSWGGSKAEAERGLRTIVAAMSQRMLGAHTGLFPGVVSRIQFGGMRDLPDRDYTPAKPRWMVTAVVTAHPLL